MGVGDSPQGQPWWGQPVGTAAPPGTVAHLVGAVVQADEEPAVLSAGQQQDKGHVGDNQVQIALGEVVVDVLGGGEGQPVRGWAWLWHPQSPLTQDPPTHDVEVALVGIDGVQQLIDVVLAGRGQWDVSPLCPPGLKSPQNPLYPPKPPLPPTTRPSSP